MRIMGIERDKLATNYYRILQPLSKLDELGMAEVQLVQERDLGDEQSRDIALWADIIVFQRPATEAWFNFIKLCRKLGKIIVSDYDDDPFRTSPLNPYYQFIGTDPIKWQWEDGTTEWLWSEDMVSPSGKKLFNIERNINHRDMFRLNFSRSDLVTTTTENLRDEFLKINSNAAILPNVIDPAFFPQVKMFKENVRIGWQGGASHYEDLYFIKSVIKAVLEQNDNVTFVYFGDLRFQGLFKDCDQSKIEWNPWVAHNVYPYKLATLNLDIGLCPLVDNEFNRNKSAIKWMEYSIMGIATIASNIPPFNVVIRNEDTGLLIDEVKQSWITAINMLVKDKKLRLRIAEDAKFDVLNNHNADKSAHLWTETYEKVIRSVTV